MKRKSTLYAHSFAGHDVPATKQKDTPIARWKKLREYVAYTNRQIYIILTSRVFVNSLSSNWFTNDRWDSIPHVVLERKEPANLGMVSVTLMLPWPENGSGMN
jgi:hypothetical protein